MIERLKKRHEFLRVNAGRRAPMPGFVLLAVERADSAPPRIGFTVTKKIGNSVTRNRLKRRLRALADQAIAEHGHAGADYVLIGRSAGIDRPFDKMAAELERALHKVHKG